MQGSTKIISPLRFNFYFSIVVLLALFGLFDSVYLAVSHYRVYTDMEYRSFCAITRSLNCDTVSQSAYSILLGLPVPIWGVFAYGFILLLIILSKDRRAEQKRILPTIFSTAILYSLTSIYFAIISTYYIRSYCIMCIAIYAVNLLILFYSWLIRRRFEPGPFFPALVKDFKFLNEKKAKAFYIFSPFLTAIILIRMFFPAYWQMPPSPFSSGISTGFTQDGHPWIGATKPNLTITEFSDYQCFQCNKMHHFLRTLIQENQEQIRLVHRHFPMDHRFNPLLKEPFHVGSGEMALMAIYAATQNKFWPVNDLLFEIGRQKRTFNTKEIGEKTDLDFRALSQARKDPAMLIRLQRDIIDGIKLGIQGTPAFLINGKVYTSQIPPEVIENALK